jgi:IclR family KDG regulon transcriptional repressor
MKREKANYLIQSVSHAFDVLEELAKAGGEIGVTELSKRLGLHKNNVFRLLATMCLRGFAEQNSESEDYRLGVKVLQLGQSYLLQSKLITRAAPILKNLVETSGETVSLVVFQNGQLQFPLSIEAKRPVRVASRLGSSVSSKALPVGKLLLCNLSERILDEFVASGGSIDEEIKQATAELRHTGIIVDKGTAESEVLSISKVVRGLNGDVVAAIELIAPQHRSNQAQLTQLVEDAANNLSSALGSAKNNALGGAIEREHSQSTTSSSAKRF